MLSDPDSLIPKKLAVINMHLYIVCTIIVHAELKFFQYNVHGIMPNEIKVGMHRLHALAGK